MPHGAYRQVVLMGEVAVKFPRLRYLGKGMRCNRWEREMWRVWRPVFGWNSLCPVLFADPLGFVVVMPRAEQPVTRDEVDGLPDYYPGTTSETKVEDHGRIDTGVVAVDYGLPDRDLVDDRRAYYVKMAKDHGQAHCDV